MMTTSMPNWTVAGKQDSFNYTFSSSSSSSFFYNSSEYDQSTTMEVWNISTMPPDTDENSAANIVILVCTPPIVLLGTAGNILCLIIMMRRHYRTCSTGVYLFCLALADNTFLYMNSMVMNFTRLTVNFDFRVLSVVTCKIYIYLLMISKCCSAWFIVAVTVERLLVISLPLKANELATRPRAWVVISGIGGVIGLVYLFPVFTYTHIDNDWWIGCDMSEHHKQLHYDIVLKFMDLILHTLLPALMLFVCNALLVNQLVRSRQLRLSLGRTGSRLRRNTGPKRLTSMLVLLSSVFLLLNLPMALYLLTAAINPHIPEQFVHWELFYRIFYVLQITNSAINFPLYCLSGPLFRRQVVELCRHIPCFKTTFERYQQVSFPSGNPVSNFYRYRRTEMETPEENVVDNTIIKQKPTKLKNIRN